MCVISHVGKTSWSFVPQDWTEEERRPPRGIATRIINHHILFGLSHKQYVPTCPAKASYLILKYQLTDHSVTISKKWYSWVMNINLKTLNPPINKLSLTLNFVKQIRPTCWFIGLTACSAWASTEGEISHSIPSGYGSAYTDANLWVFQ